MADGACLEHPEVEFIPADQRSEDKAIAARAICGRCLCRAECLAYSLADPTLLGIWAETTTAERRDLRRRSAACRLPTGVPVSHGSARFRALAAGMDSMPVHGNSDDDEQIRRMRAESAAERAAKAYWTRGFIKAAYLTGAIAVYQPDNA